MLKVDVFEVRVEGDMVALRFIDNGHGVPPAKRSEIFLPFVRVEGGDGGEGGYGDGDGEEKEGGEGADGEPAAIQEDLFGGDDDDLDLDDLSSDD